MEAEQVANLHLQSPDQPPHVPPRYRNNPFGPTVRQRHQAKDITNIFDDCSSDLSLGELIQDASFTLFDAVQAIEVTLPYATLFSPFGADSYGKIGDPKMDSGYLEDGDTLEDDYDVSTPLSPDQVIGIMDRLLCYELAWHRGYPLSQTVFTSLHLDWLLTHASAPHFPTHATASTTASSPHELLHLVLRAYCIATIKSIDITIEMVTAKQYYEEEDLCTNTYGRVLLTDFPDDECLDLLESSCDWVKSQFEQGLGISEDQATALHDRLQVRIMLMKPFAQIDQPPAPPLCMDLLKLRLSNLKDSIKDSAVQEAFSSKIQRRLASTVPPRPPIEITLRDACKELSIMSDHITAAFNVSQYDALVGSQTLRNFLRVFSAMSPAPAVFPRAFLQHLMFEGKVANRQAIGQLTQVAVAETALFETRVAQYLDEMDVRLVESRRIQEFLRGASEYLSHVFASMCQNRTRIRRSLMNNLGELAQLQSSLDFECGVAQEDQARRLCAETQPLLQSWIGKEYCSLTAETILQGFELDVYGIAELSMNYWLASYFLSKASAEYDDTILDEYVGGLGQLYETLFGRHPTPSQASHAVSTFTESVSFRDACADLHSCFADTFALLQGLKLVPTVPITAWSFRVGVYEKRRVEIFDPPSQQDWQTWSKKFQQQDKLQAIQHITETLNGVLSSLKAYKALKDPALKWSEGCETGVNNQIDGFMKSAIVLKLFVSQLQGEWKKGSLQQFQVKIQSLEDRRHPRFIVPVLVKKA